MQHPSFLLVAWLMRTMYLFPVLCLLLVAAEGRCSSSEQDAGSDNQALQPHLPLIIGHQGAAGLAPGNTLASIALAIDLGVDAIELDTMLSADGILVVHHDFMLHPERTRNSEGKWLEASHRIPVRAMTLDQLRTYDVGRLKPGSKLARRFSDLAAVDGQKIPTLQEVFAIIQQSAPNAPQLFLEIKTSPEELDVSPSLEIIADKLVQLIEDHNLSGQCKILSFDWRALARVKAIAPAIPTVYLSSRYKQLKFFDKETTLLWTAGIDPDEYDRSLPAMIQAAGGKSWGAKHSEIWQSHVQKAHEAGLKVYVWTVDSKSDMRHFVDIGIDGIITNRPDLLKEVVAEKHHSLTTN